MWRGVAHVCALSAALGAAVLFFTGGAGAQGAPLQLVRLAATPTLFPAYSPGVHDYVVRCTDASRTKIVASASAGTRVTIDGRSDGTAALALWPGQAVTVAVARGAKSAEYHVRCLPADFPTWQVAGAGTSGRWYVTTPSMSLGDAESHYVVIYDGNGVPVWWYRDAGVPIDATVLPGEKVAYAEFDGSSPAYQVRHLDGTLVGRITSPDGQIDDHELEQVADGDDVYLVYEPKQHVDLSSFGGPDDATVFEGRIEERTPAGKVVWSWSTDGHIGLDEVADWASSILQAPVTTEGADPIYDIVHANSVSVLGETVLLSLRYADAMYAIDRASGNILWKLGGTPTSESLTVLGDPLGANPLVGQHDARLLADGTVTVFDDGSFVRPPRAVRYRIDPVARTATYVSSISDPDVTTSSCCGSARLLEDGDWLVSWGAAPVVGVYDPNGTALLTLGFDGLFSYRAVPVDTAHLTAGALRAGMNAMAPRPVDDG